MGSPGKRLTVAAGSRPTTSGRGPAKPSGFREGPVGLGVTHHWPFFITYRAGKPVMYEYQGPSNTKSFSYKLRWPQRGRNYYREGDMILHRETPGGKYLKWAFPTLASRSGEETLLERLIDSEILGPASNYQAASVIWAIRPSRTPGQGVLYTKPVLFFGKTAVLLADERTRRHNIQQLTDQVAFDKARAAMLAMLPFLYAVSEIMLMVISGAAKAAVSRSVAVYVARKGAVTAASELAKKQAAKALAKSMAKNLASASAKATLDFAKAFLQEAASSGAEESIRKKAASNEKVDYGVLREAIKKGVQAFAAKFVEECLGTWIGAFAKQSGAAGTAREYIAKQLAPLITTEPTSALISAYRKAGLESERGRTGTSAKTQMDMASELQGWFTGKMKGVLKDLIGTMVGG